MAATRGEEYQGWSNYETWAVALILDNNRESYEKIRSIVATRGKPDLRAARHSVAVETALRFVAHDIKEYVEEIVEDVVTSGVSDVQSEMVAQLTHAALERVDWREIAEHEMAD